MLYGIPYMGSKSGIALDVIKVLPPAEHFYDIFGGGFSITHAALLRRSKSYKHFHFNEIKADFVDLIKKAVAGEFSYEVFKPKFVTREEFFAKKDSDPYIRCVWSFGNNQKAYLFGEDVEGYKRSMHNAVVFNEFDAQAKKVFGFSRFQDGYIKIERIYVNRKGYEKTRRSATWA